MGSVGGGKERCVGSEEVWVGVWESVCGEWGSVLVCGGGMWQEEWVGVGKGMERHGEVWGPNTLPPTPAHPPYLFPQLPLPHCILCSTLCAYGMVSPYTAGKPDCTLLVLAQNLIMF